MVFAAGLGSRLRPLTDMIPKALVPINGMPLLEHVLLKIKGAGIQDVVSGWLIDSNITETVNELGEVVKHYDFSQAAIFWIGASIISFLLPILNWGKKVKEE